MREAVGLVQHFGESYGFREASRRPLHIARQLLRVAALRVRANAGIVTAELMTEVTVARHVVEFDTVSATVQSPHDVALEEGRRPLAVIPLEQQFVIVGVPRKRYEFGGTATRERGLAPEI